MTICFIIIGLLFSVFSTIKNFKFFKISINIITAPLAVFLILYLFGIIDNDIIVKSIIGNNLLKPYEIIIIFYTVAYVSISVDLSGVLDFFAFKLIKHANNNGLYLFCFFYFFSCILTIFTSNDIVILTLTPIVFYLRKYASINIIPLLFAEFFGANTTSMLLYIGNPTNIIIANSLNLSFLDYTKIMFMPTVIATCANFILLLLVFKKKITKVFILHDNKKLKLRSISDAIISSSLLILMLLCLLVSERFSLKIWHVTLFFCLIFIVEDMIISIFYTVKNYKLYITEISKGLKEVYKIYGFSGERHDLFIIIKRLPWKILPFLFVMFVLITSLSEYGFISVLSSFISNISDSIFVNIFVYGITSFLLSNIINNQPMSILFSNIFTDKAHLMSELNLKASSYAVIIASNLGANLSLIGALAGVMWEKILRKNNLRVNYFIFLKVGISVTLFVFVISLLTLYYTLN